MNKQLSLLSDAASPEGALALRLFRLLFDQCAANPDMEAVLLPHLTKMTDKWVSRPNHVPTAARRLLFCHVALLYPRVSYALVAPAASPLTAYPDVWVRRALRAAVSERDASGYLQLLRSYFKALSAASSKLKLSYTALSPYVEPCLSLMLQMIAGPHTPQARGVLLEICLTLPAPLAGVLQLLPRLMRPLTLAIKVGLAAWSALPGAGAAAKAWWVCAWGIWAGRHGCGDDETAVVEPGSCACA